jgi:hypothetical protein
VAIGAKIGIQNFALIKWRIPAASPGKKTGKNKQEAKQARLFLKKNHV